MNVHLERWGPNDLALLTALLGDPAMMEHLGGPESPEQLAARQARFEKTPGMYKIVADEPVGSVGYWERGEDAYEVGWSVLPAHQGKGYATIGMQLLLEVIRVEGNRRYVHAYPSVDNAPSNAICRKVGFTLLGPQEFEYPKGHFMQCNDWQLDLGA
ncbi:MAG TPA: GNAT family N-acetyltransferase [Gaiellaceae bacterium]|nr:GNAT family N-acetyltransferase [Gaiellaceae bacterium]